MAYNLHDARKRVKALVPDAKAIIELNEALDELAGIEGKISEANTRKNHAEADTQRIVAGLEDASRKLSVANSEIEAAQQKAHQIISDAQTSAAEIVAKAKGLRAEIDRNAEAVVRKSVQESDAAIAAGKAELANIEQQIADKRDALANVNRELVNAQGALEVVRADRDALIRRLKG